MGFTIKSNHRFFKKIQSLESKPGEKWNKPHKVYHSECSDAVQCPV